MLLCAPQRRRAARRAPRLGRLRKLWHHDGDVDDAPWANRLSGWSFTARGQTVRLPVSPLLHTDRFGLPLNGVQSRRDAWILQHSGATGRSAWLDALLPFDRDPRQLELFPFPHRLYLHAEVTHRSLHLAIEIEATTLSPVPVCCGYRVYIRREPARGTTTLVLPARQRVLTDERLLPSGPRTHLEMNASTPGIDDLDELFVLGTDRSLSVASSSRRLTLEPLAGFGFAHVQSDHREPHIMIETLTTTPDALSRGQFPVALLGRPYRAALRLSIDDISLLRPTLTAMP